MQVASSDVTAYASVTRETQATIAVTETLTLVKQTIAGAAGTASIVGGVLTTWTAPT